MRTSSPSASPVVETETTMAVSISVCGRGFMNSAACGAPPWPRIGTVAPSLNASDTKKTMTATCITFIASSLRRRFGSSAMPAIPRVKSAAAKA